MSTKASRRGLSAVAWFNAQSFHTSLAAPATGRILDALLQDNRATDAAISAARDEDRGDELSGSQCGVGCGFCGRCS